MESLPLILQFALFLLGFALSRYIWGIDSSVSAVMHRVHGSGVPFLLEHRHGVRVLLRSPLSNPTFACHSFRGWICCPSPAQPRADL
ncbi:hypothetical protein BJ322DRAFT_471194 [Thelephora terrestris]|uniref:Uncharacterized protein n=1 Tax=Thelephora terrestris TaxID=56493 RepID=A0A9P6L1V2_9AGAM|nr:hypothetical protein BJ322DRAFT_471194 [Thelephora terrestris]